MYEGSCLGETTLGALHCVLDHLGDDVDHEYRHHHLQPQMSQSCSEAVVAEGSCVQGIDRCIFSIGPLNPTIHGIKVASVIEICVLFMWVLCMFSVAILHFF